jgi:hypothetical protein
VESSHYRPHIKFVFPLNKNAPFIGAFFLGDEFIDVKTLTEAKNSLHRDVNLLEIQLNVIILTETPRKGIDS